MAMCSICQRDVPMTIPVQVTSDDPEGEPSQFEVCLRCESIITVVAGGDKYAQVMKNYQNVIDIMLSTLVNLEVMLARDLEYDHDQEPRKSVREDLDKWITLASYDLTSRRP